MLKLKVHKGGGELPEAAEKSSSGMLLGIFWRASGSFRPSKSILERLHEWRLLCFGILITEISHLEVLEEDKSCLKPCGTIVKVREWLERLGGKSRR